MSAITAAVNSSPILINSLGPDSARLVMSQVWQYNQQAGILVAVLY